MRGARLVPLILDCVAQNGRTEVVKVLLAAGADKTAKDKDGKTALDYAEGWGKWGKEEIKALLR